MNSTIYNNKHKNILQKIERHEFEHKTKFLKTNLENQLLLKTTNKEKLIHEISNIDKDIEVMNLELDIIMNFEKYNNLDTKIYQMQTKVGNSPNRKQRVIDEDDYYRRITLLQV